ncbi:hypothetical protein [Embleya sp. NPDC005575]|uniref:hypothetical protein n=1 Tax=Embleya sp. NPDC005575 TaxID=3156892 RepID=UPI0033BE66A0
MRRRRVAGRGPTGGFGLLFVFALLVPADGRDGDQDHRRQQGAQHRAVGGSGVGEFLDDRAERGCRALFGALATIGALTPSPWLFPGGRPGRPISTGQPTKRLNNLGIHPNRARNTALFQLATEIPAAILARTLGIHTDVAVAWQRLSAGDWATYAARVSARTSAAKESSS